jgi:hypothetical protein
LFIELLQNLLVRTHTRHELVLLRTHSSVLFFSGHGSTLICVSVANLIDNSKLEAFFFFAQIEASSSARSQAPQKSPVERANPAAE